MLLRQFKNNSSVMHIVTVVVAVLLWLPIITNQEWQPRISEGSVFYNSIYNSLFSSQWTGQIIAFVLMLLEAFLLLWLDLRIFIFEKKNILPPFLFVLLVSVFAPNYNLLPMMLANLFFLFSISRAMHSEFTVDSAKNYFESSLFIGLGTLFYPPMFAMLMFVLVALFIMKNSGLREFLAIILGFITPFVFYIFFTFIDDRPAELFTRMEQLLVPHESMLDLSIIQYCASGFSVLFILTAIIAMSQLVRTYKITSRKFFSIFIWNIIIAVAAYFLIPASGLTLLILASMAISFIGAMYFFEIRRRVPGEIVFCLIIICAFLIVYL